MQSAGRVRRDEGEQGEAYGHEIRHGGALGCWDLATGTSQELSWGFCLHPRFLWKVKL